MKQYEKELIKRKHTSWFKKFRTLVETGTGMDEITAFSCEDCEVGKWLYSTGMTTYGNLPAMQAFELTHARMHIKAKHVIILKRTQNIERARAQLKKLAAISEQLLTQIEAFPLD